MTRLREIPRTATFAWSPGTSLPYIATGTRAGAVDADFSNDSRLELWDLNLNNFNQNYELQPVASVDTDSRFHDISWVQENDTFSRGVIAGALENGSLDLWNAEKLLNGKDASFMSRTSTHSGAIKALQFNPFRLELLATAGAKGELFISDLNHINNPFRMGNSVARADDFECLDWNKKVPHIMATGSSGGFVTVWDVKTKKESLTLNNLGRKAVSAIAWDPDKHTRLVTAIPHDTDPLILVWDLRNSNAPERVLQGHDGGVLSISWCPQDNDLLLSCGKDNRSICWNPQTGEAYGEFAVVTNWTFQTRWNPHNPNLLATASFDGKIKVQSIQNTKSDTSPSSGGQSQVTDDEDFFNKAHSQPQGASFTLQKAPKWLEKPCGASFGFGGKLVSFGSSKTSGAPRHSYVRISPFAIDEGVGLATESFEVALKKNDLGSVCKTRVSSAISDTDRADWKIIKTLTSENPRKQLISYLGFASVDDEGADGLSNLSGNEAEIGSSESAEPNKSSVAKSNRLSAFFDNNPDTDSFLSDLAATKGAKINNPFKVYSGSESESDRRITRALLLGEFDKALDACLQEDRLSDAFMIAICGGQDCINKAQKAYFNRKSGGPNYLRLLASVVGKNLWDVVYNADLLGWKEVMAVLCTYASAEEFPDLCEALGDRLEEQMKAAGGDVNLRKDASFCYLAGSKLEKVVEIWIAELDEDKSFGPGDPSSESTFSIYARSLQNFIEKVTIFREVTHFQDNDQLASSGWKLTALYNKYAEYADIVASHGQLQIAERYLKLLPERYPAAEVARNRVKEAIDGPKAQSLTKQPLNAAQATQRVLPNAGNTQGPPNPAKNPTSGVINPYVASAQATSQSFRPQVNSGHYNAGSYRDPTKYQQPHSFPHEPQQVTAPPSTYSAAYQGQNVGPPPRNLNPSPSIPPPSQAQNMSNWNDTPESFFKAPTSRRGTPGAGLSSAATPQPMLYGVQPKSTPALAPPPKGSVGPPPRMNSPSATTLQSHQQHERPSSSATNTYSPQQPTLNPEPSNQQRPLPEQELSQQRNPIQQQGLIPRGPSPYHAPPSAPPPSNRYAPAPSANQAAPIRQPEPGIPGLNRQGPPPPNPYAPQQNYNLQQQNASSQTGTNAPMPPSATVHPKSEIPVGPPQVLNQASRPGTAQSHHGTTPIAAPPKYPPGDRSHIPSSAKAIFEVLNNDMQRVKARAPQNFKTQVLDTEKRLNILFDHLNNGDLLKEDTIQDMVQLAQALHVRNFDQAQAIHIDIMTNKTEECGNWMVGVKRLILMSKSTP